MPLLRIEPVADARFGAGPWSGVVFTSANAVRAVAAHPPLQELTGLPAYTVGRAHPGGGGGRRVRPARSSRTATSTTSFAWSRPMAGDAGLPLLYFAGSDRAGDLAAALATIGRRSRRSIVYRAVAVGDFDADVRAAISGRPRSMRCCIIPRAPPAAFVAAAQGRRACRSSAMKIKHLCLSAQVAAPLAAPAPPPSSSPRRRMKTRSSTLSICREDHVVKLHCGRNLSAVCHWQVWIRRHGHGGYG